MKKIIGLAALFILIGVNEGLKDNPPKEPQSEGGGGNSEGSECHGGGCKAIQCTITLSNSGGGNIGGNGISIGFGGTLSCTTYKGSGAYCCCWQSGSKIYARTKMSSACGC